jgi:hypothetical protein
MTASPTAGLARGHRHGQVQGVAGPDLELALERPRPGQLRAPSGRRLLLPPRRRRLLLRAAGHVRAYKPPARASFPHSIVRLSRAWCAL